MKKRSRELYEKSLSAMIAAIEIFNKPNFEYREETYAILAINSWELLLKAKWLEENSNKVGSLFVLENKTKKDGTKSRKKKAKISRSGNPLTHSIDYLATKLIETGKLEQTVWGNVQGLIEIRDTAIHFYNKSVLFQKRLQEIGMASVKNFVALSKAWFNQDLGGYNFYLMPLAFVQLPEQAESLILNREEANLVAYLDALDKSKPANAKYDVSISINISFKKSTTAEAVRVQITKDPTAPRIQLSEEQIREQYPWSYVELNKRCKERYSDFKQDQKYHDLRRAVRGDRRFCHTRFLDPGNPKSGKKDFYNPNMLNYLDEHYPLKET